MRVEVKDLSKVYGSKEVLKDISMKLEGGMVYGLVGENGSGKTTLFKCIAGLEDFSGELSSDLSTLKNHIGLLLTEPFFLSKITGREYIILMCDARGQSYTDVDKKNVFDLPLDNYASTYSTGMKKKLAILAILMQGNDFLILDEPFNGVDAQSNILISEIIKELKQLGKTVLISSHILSSLTDLCDEIFLLDQGKIKGVYEQADFDLLESDMKSRIISDKIKLLGLH
jgi:ABC-2 type transport system ATP-binding protein